MQEKSGLYYLKYMLTLGILYSKRVSLTYSKIVIITYSRGSQEGISVVARPGQIKIWGILTIQLRRCRVNWTQIIGRPSFGRGRPVA